MWMTGEPGRAPLRISCPPQSYLHASAVTAAGLLLALHHRQICGEGQHVDTSAQQCPTWMLTHTYAYWDLLGINLRRAGTRRQFGETLVRTVWPCKDGYVTFVLAGGLIGAKGQRRLVELVDKEGMADDWLKEFKWEEWSAAARTQEQIDKLTAAFSRFFKTKTKAQLLDAAVKNNIMLAPVNTVADLMTSPQLKDRDYWVDIEHRELGANITYPGAPCKLTETPWQIRGRAPLVGEHNTEVYEDELGFSNKRMQSLESAGVI